MLLEILKHALVSALAILWLGVLETEALPRPHIIGGGLNSVLSSRTSGAVSMESPAWLVSLLSSVRSSQSSPSSDSAPSVQHPVRSSPGSDTSLHVISSVHETVGPVPGLQDNNASPLVGSSGQLRSILRSRREAECQIPEGLPAQVQMLNSFLTVSQFVGLNPEQPTYVPVPSGQPDQCPSSTNSWWPGQGLNLRSNCPWVYQKKDFGEKFFPRYHQEAKCLCTDCINATGMSCEDLRQSVTVFKREGCKDGLAVMKKTEQRLTVGCYCASAQVPVTDNFPIS